MSNNSPEKDVGANDEISLAELVDAIKQGWKPILGCSVAGAVLATALAFALPEKYEVSFYIDKPFASQLQEVNLGRTALTGLPQISPEEVHNYFLKELLANSSKIRFFNEVYLPAQAKQPMNEQEKLALQEATLERQVQIIEPKPKGRQELQIRVEAPSAEKAVTWAQDFLRLTEQEARTTWLADVKSGIHLAIMNTEKDLQEKMALAKQLREDRSVQLGEALKVAQAVGQKVPQLTSGRLPSQDSVAGFADGSRLYARGAKSLQAELEVLKNRKDDTPFMDGLRETELRLKLLKAQQPEAQKIAMYRVDGGIFKPVRPFFPKKSLFLLGGLFLGSALGFLLALKKSGIFRLRA